MYLPRGKHMSRRTRATRPPHWPLARLLLVLFGMLVPVLAVPVTLPVPLAASTTAAAAAALPRTPHSARRAPPAPRTAAAPQPAPPTTGFSVAAPQGFGDRQNSWAWAMAWWQPQGDPTGHLYVGTNRAWPCANAQAQLYVGGTY